MPKSGKILVMIPAFNEEKFIGNTIDLIRKTGMNAEILVVNDGSTDKTAEIAREKGCIVVTLPKNLGKANAFFAGVKEALKRNADAVLTIDADAIRIPKKTIEKLANVAFAATRKKEAKMFVAPFREDSGTAMAHSGFTSLYFSGIRSFSRQALWKLRLSRLKSAPKGFGLESFQTQLFKNNAIALKAPAVTHAPAYRTADAATNQERDSRITQYRMRKRGMFR